MSWSVEQMFRSTLREAYPTSWDENHITLDTLHRLRSQFDDVQVAGEDATWSVRWNAFKMNGSAEQRFGDIAVVVTLRSSEGPSIDGVAFVEAKKRAKGKNSFDALKRGQLRRILSRAPRASVLFYDYRPIILSDPQFELDYPLVGPWSRFHDHEEGLARVTQAAVAQANLVLSTRLKDTRIYSHAVPFSWQLVHRFLRGFDLELDARALAIAGGQRERHESPWIVLHASVTETGVEPSGFRVNPEVYSSLDLGHDRR